VNQWNPSAYEEAQNKEGIDRLKEPVNLPRQLLEVFEAWKQLSSGEITPAQFQQELINLKEGYFAVVDKPKAPNEDLLWKQYELETNLFKHYLELILKFNAFYYVVTGAILSFYFTKADVPLVRYALLFPVLMSIVFGVLFGYGVFLNRVTRADIFKIRDELRLEVAPEVNVLGALLAMSATLMFVVAGVLLWFFFPNLIAISIGFIAVILLLLWSLFR
jgi:hypothetical protein